MRYAVESLPFHDVPLEVMAAEASRLGFTQVNLWSSAPPLAAHVDVYRDEPDQVRGVLSRYRLEPCGLTMYGRSRDDIARGIVFASRLGARSVIFDCEADYPSFTGEFLPPLLRLAAEQGITICVENHLTVPFTPDFEQGGHEDDRWAEGVDSFAQIKRLIAQVDDPHLKICLAPSHLWVMNESVLEVATYLLERDKLGYYYMWDVSRGYRRGHDGLNFGPGEEQLPRPGGTLNHRLLLRALGTLGYAGVASLKCHGTAGWPLEKVTAQLGRSWRYLSEA